MKRVNHVLIGADIARTSDLDISATGSQNLAEGEVFVADKNKQLLSSGATIADTDTIYIGVGSSETYDYTDPSGSEVTGVRKIKWSTPIEGRMVKNYKAMEADNSASEAAVTIESDGFSSASSGDELVVRAVFTDVSEHPGQFAQDYRIISTGTWSTDVDTMISKINNYSPSRVTATKGSVHGTYGSGNDIVIVAKDVSDDSKDAIDEYHQVNFHIFLNGDDDTWSNLTVTREQNPHPGHGNPKLVRDKEKHAQGYEGITNRYKFPVVKPDLDVNMSKWYDAIVIEHDKSYISTEMDFEKEMAHTTEVYIPDGAGQANTAPSSGHDAVLNVLNPWMASLPKAFSNVSV